MATKESGEGQALAVVSLRLPDELVAESDRVVEAIRTKEGADWRDRKITRADVLRQSIEIGLKELAAPFATAKKVAVRR
jgi:hypothetical protein